MSSSGELSPEAVEARIERLRADLELKQIELERLLEELNWWERGRQFFNPEGNGAEPLTPQGRTPGKPTLRQAILKVMLTKPNTTWQAETIIMALRGRDWLPGGKNGEHRTRSKLAEMERAGELRRKDRGRYRLVNPEIEV